MQAALEQAAAGWRQADQRHSREQADAEAQAWRASLWAARQLQLAVAPAARTALADPRHPVAVRREAIRCLVECGDAKDSKALWQALEDVDSGVRTAASAALARLGGDPVLPHLERAKSVDGATLRPVLRGSVRGGRPFAVQRLNSGKPRRRFIWNNGKSRRWLAQPRRLVGNQSDPARLQPWSVGGEAAQTALQNILDNKCEDNAIRSHRVQKLAGVGGTADSQSDCSRG